MKNVTLSMRGAYEAGFTQHPQLIMRESGVSGYCLAVSQSMTDSWDFWGCENLPDPLPEFLHEIKCPPKNFIGRGLSQKDVDNIEDHYARGGECES